MTLAVHPYKVVQDAFGRWRELNPDTGFNILTLDIEREQPNVYSVYISMHMKGYAIPSFLLREDIDLTADDAVGQLHELFDDLLEAHQLVAKAEIHEC